MSGMTPLLLTPRPWPAESFSSWITRAALSQGVTYQDFLELMPMEAGTDVDMMLVSQDFPMMAKALGLKPDDLSIAKWIFGGLTIARLDPKRFLLHSARHGRPRFRYCPHCLRDQRTSHFPIHWRFVAFRYCPSHQCLLEEQCHACRAPIVLPATQLYAGRDKRGLAHLYQCMSCGHDLRNTEAMEMGVIYPMISSWDAAMLRNGIAVLAALYHRHVLLSEAGAAASISMLRRLDLQGVLPNRFDWLRPDSVREQLRQVKQRTI